MIKKLDIIIIAILLLLSFVPSVFISSKNNSNFSDIYAEIQVAGKVIDKISFSNINEEKEIPIHTKYGDNIIRISKDGVYMYKADCPDKVCLKDGTITKFGQSLVCLPHKLIIEIKGVRENNDDEIIISH